MNAPALPQGAQLWALHTGMHKVGLGMLQDLSNVPKTMREVETKYCLSHGGTNGVDGAISALFGKIGGYLSRRKYDVELRTFVGIDQYYIFGAGNGREFHFRYRSGANRPPQLSVKYQLNAGSNLSRGEINVPVERADPANVQTFMSVVAAISPQPPITFAIQQSGEIWIAKDPKTSKKVEVVVYRVRRIEPSEHQGAFVEIEPLEYEDVDDARAIIDRFETALGLGSMVCAHSIAEMFRPGAESVLANRM